MEAKNYSELNLTGSSKECMKAFLTSKADRAHADELQEPPAGKGKEHE